jgi:dTDP-4-amino-4,6-dideoxygalactose transaminase
MTLLKELARYDEDMLVKRKIIFDDYSAAFSKFNRAQLPVYETENKISSYHVYLLRIKDINERQRDKIIQLIFKKGVSVNVHFIPLPMMTYYKNLGYDINNYPVSFDNYSREISLPVYYDLTNKNVKKIIDAVIKSVEEVLSQISEK